MLLMRGATSDLKVMAESADRPDPTTSATTTKKTNTLTGKNNNKTNFKSQSPSEDKAIRYGGLPCETDHMYANYAGESGKYRELANEVAHLKAMVLFHLDLIQQQSECNAAKDKQLSALRQENEMLRQRLERMERRVQLQSSKQKPDGIPEVLAGKPAESPSTSSQNEVRLIAKVPESTPPHVPEQSIGEVPRKRIKTLLPVRPAMKRRRSGKEEFEELDDLIDQPVIIPEVLETETFDVLPEHQRIRDALSQKIPPRDLVHLKKDVILTTDQHYLTHVGEYQLEALTNDSQVEVPQWIVKPLTGRNSAQGIENLDDEVFTKRHLKHEIDEKRRKRWDAQRVREQRRYEKLRARYEGEDRSQDRVRSQQAPTAGITASLWADPEDVAQVQVEPWLPVSVFGAPLPNVTITDFQLPWSNSRSLELTEPKRRQRRKAE